MIYLSAALVIIAILFTVHPPTITFHKVMTVREGNNSYTPVPDTSTKKLKETDTHKAGTDEDFKKLKELNEERPPSLEDVVATMNEILYEMGGDE